MDGGEGFSELPHDKLTTHGIGCLLEGQSFRDLRSACQVLVLLRQ